MKFNFSAMLLTLRGATTAPAAIAADQDVVIGDIDDLSGLYSDVSGPGAARERPRQ